MFRFHQTRRPPFWLFFLLGALMAALPYGLVAVRFERPGFPLDDAWIYQTFARTWADAGTWGARPNQPAAGATAPLWVWPIALGYRLLPQYPLWWTWGLGLLLLSWLAWRTFQEARRLGLSSRRAGVLGSLLLFEWHLVWAALSGMETLAFGVLAWWTLRLLQRKRPPWGRVGWMVGLGVWIRPEALLLLLPWAWRVGWLPHRRERWRALWNTGFPLLVLLTLYPLFQLLTTGHPWPNTAQAKIVEYASLRSAPFLWRWFQVALPPFIGPALFLLPWVFLYLRRHPLAWGDLIWVVAHITLYALRLPVTYQHGRYMMPILPILLWWGGMGLLSPASSNTQPSNPWHRRWIFFRNALLMTLTLSFWLLGARTYTNDVALIESEMVNAAQWVRDHLQPEALVAAHDIGALGYFAPQPLIDLAGLLTPEVIPRLRDPDALAEYLNERGAEYLVLFPNWYGPEFVACSQPLYRTQGLAPQFGGENMVVYRWRPCPPSYR